MSHEFDAIYTQGHLVPLQPLPLKEQERVRVHLVPVEDEGATNGAGNAFSNMSFHEALVAVGLLGSIEGLPEDLSTNPKYMEGFGEDDRPAD